MTAEHISSVLTSLGPALANHLWQSTAFAAFVGSLTMLLRRHQARIRFALWLAASIKFLVPFSLLIALGGLLPKPQHVVAGSQTGLYAAIDVAGQPFSVGSAPPIGSAVPARSLFQELTERWPLVLAGIWLFGASVVLLIWFARWRQVYAILRRASPIQDGREIRLLRRLEEATGRRGRMELRLSPERMEPGVFSIVRPVLIWPERLSERLDEEQMEAILAHEMTHQRRQDNLAAAIHMLVEILFWFHPTVWWMERRMVEERERACDEEVVRLGSSPEVYAEGLLKACRFCVEAPLVCVSGITGADLSRRVRSIVTLRLGRSLGLKGKLLLVSAASLAIIAPVMFGLWHRPAVLAQTVQPTGHAQLAVPVTIHLDAVSIKENRSDADQGYLNIPPNGDRIVVTNTPMFRIIGFAFDKQRSDLIEGLPAWTRDARWDIEAKISEDSLDAFRHLPFDKQKEVLQQILKARCEFAAHSGKKEVPVYALTVLKSGTKLREVPPSRPDASTPGWDLKQSSGRIEGRAVPIEALMYVLSKAGLDRQVIDRTGLKGCYDISLTWTPEEKFMSSQATGPEDDSPSASIFTAVQDELGLKLEATKAVVDAVIVTHIDRPSAN